MIIICHIKDSNLEMHIVIFSKTISSLYVLR